MIQESVEKKKNKKDKNDKKSKKIKRVHVEEKPEKKPENKKKIAINWDIQKEAIYKSVKQNYIFYIVLIACLYAFAKDTNSNSNSNSNINSKYSFIIAVGTICFITLYGYMMHFISHSLNTNLSRIYSQYDNFFTRNKYTNSLAKKFIYFMEFHATTHHDSDVNKQFKNIVLEFLNNLATQGVMLIMVKYLLNFLDNRVVLLWAFFYATVHNMNYVIVKPSTHKEHHIDDKTNYGIDIWDILIGSKYDWNNIETHNHTAINLIVITAVILYLSRKMNK